MSVQERVLFVHAHPDDETIASGGTIATLVDSGAVVTVVTCTRGERGEVIPASLQHLLTSEDALAEHRERELAAALAILGVTDHRYLGEGSARWVGRDARRYRDSGMEWGESGAQALPDLDPDSLVAADFGEVASDVAAVVADVRPDVIVSYNDFGGYGHPDHIRAARAARRAAEVYNVPYFAIEPRDSAAASTLDINVAGVLDRKRSAMAAHATQIAVDGDSFALSNGVSQPIDSIERFRRVRREYPAGRAPFVDQSLPVKVVSALVGLIVGVAVGAMLTVAHQASFVVGTVTVPYGLIIGVIIFACLLAGLRLIFGTRLIAATCALGILLAVGTLSLRSGGGSVLVPATAAGYIWTAAPTVIALVVLGWPQLPPRRHDKIEAPSEVKGSLPQ
ncbi:N-acetyl-1-D-myo-inositol-2-amino-2-deoxy-alpha-D-glucopyranoside deacetylase [Glaciihabitans tibetensis]|uniref:N-acetyl-1-D-myo-inositol-2-amino-2-deoxy-alpha-D-glucopyranoside deacetylase n=1 Tax=Glaciihabitans tibetensis TaxID=1266600 RepID=A0A2T0VGR8_9MICO|nr:PIG-L family deacetylase [Glaciihabitans tibetensis]PRY69418.1 N-acetyl-1-D-myo-inositol-2-amino-2-deoxy-alpha-D-glucopyranoside deacetylase [Glaciihabitans tibetensis]